MSSSCGSSSGMFFFSASPSSTLQIPLILLMESRSLQVHSIYNFGATALLAEGINRVYPPCKLCSFSLFLSRMTACSFPRVTVFLLFSIPFLLLLFFSSPFLSSYSLPPRFLLLVRCFSFDSDAAALFCVSGVTGSLVTKTSNRKRPVNSI